MINEIDIPNAFGIYLIKNVVNGKGYIGQGASQCNAKGLRERYRYHFRLLRNNIHPNNYLQRSYNKYGKECFDFIVLEEINDTNTLSERECYWITQLGTLSPNGYNLELPKTTDAPRVMTECVRQKMRDAKLGTTLSKEHKSKISQSLSGKQKSKTHLINQSESRAQDWIITDPQGDRQVIHNLSRFCGKNGLERRGMQKVASGLCKSYKGWICYKVDE